MIMQTGDVLWLFLWIALAIGCWVIAFTTSHKWAAIFPVFIFLILMLWLNPKVAMVMDIWYILRIISVVMIFASAAMIFFVGAKKDTRDIEQRMVDEDDNIGFNEWLDDEGRIPAGKKQKEQLRLEYYREKQRRLDNHR